MLLRLSYVTLLFLLQFMVFCSVWISEHTRDQNDLFWHSNRPAVQIDTW